MTSDSVPYGIDALEALVTEATALARTAAESWQREEADVRVARSAVAQEAARHRAALAAEAETKDPPVDVEAGCRALAVARDRDQARLARMSTQLRQAIRTRLEQDIRDLANLPVPQLDLASIDPFRLSDLSGKRSTLMAKVGQLRQASAGVAERIAQAHRRSGLRQPAAIQVPTTLPSWELSRVVGLVQDEIAATGRRVDELPNEPLSRLSSRVLAIGGHVLLAVIHGGAIAATLRWTDGGALLMGLGISAVLTQAGLAGAVALARRRLGLRLHRLHQEQQTHEARLGLIADGVERAYDPRNLLREEQFAAQTKERTKRTDELRAAADLAQESVRRREGRLKARIDTRLTRHQDELRSSTTRAAAVREERLARAREDLERTIAERQAAVEARWEDRRAALQTEWDRAAALLARATAAAEAARAEHPAWDDVRWSTWAPGATATGVPVGVATRSVADLVGASEGTSLPMAEGVVTVPVALSAPDRGSLLVRTDVRSRDVALHLANAVVLRSLTGLPPGRVKLLLVDPVNLGSSYAGLLDLADHDESLVSGSVLVQPERIERGLEDLQAHVEVVIQKYLRGKYATIDDYNRQAGELQEAHRLLVVADFPTGFTDRALDRLGALLRSGPRCGVNVILLHDERKPLPAQVEAAWFRTHGVALRASQGRLSVDLEALRGWDFAPEVPPPAAQVADLVARVGRQAQAVRRVEVAFATVAPPEGARWSLSADRSLRVPVGKCGADRLQYFELGVGTAQHALIGGRTGSGKSTLFHVLVASAALWYHPREVEFHLIDFKKGVEFKTYATNHLPHARVIAIESDREFGLSVLRNLDRELTRRGEAFRKAGSHDLAAYRATGAEFLPRIILLIDEFQEFFTEDDAVARDASLLLDRFVRQGRAFGLHVVLGSQTLAGAYTMARSSIGQMGVRIALPCNETDAHLLLHEENDAARLLSRPGDGIYNDRAGLTEGNSPFQVCWLPEAEETAALRTVAARTEADGWKPATRTVVFEGNGPAHLEDEGDLLALAARAPRPEDAHLRAVIGQASSLSGATQVELSPAAGGNLLIIGQHREGAAATTAALLLGFSVRYPADGLRLLALDGEDSDGPFAQLHARLAPVLRQAPVRHEARAAADVVAELSGLLERRQAGTETDLRPVVLTVFALQRLRALRPDDDAYGRAGDEPPSERFARLLSQGPEYGIHVVAWCDSLASVQRSLSRRSLRDFDTRLLFQMSATDSSELIDDDAASRLGQHTALLSVLAEGKREKFRPFSAPGEGFLEQLREMAR